MGVTIFPGPTNKQVDFTSSGTWVCPSGVYSAEFLVVGAGGGGGGVSVSGATMNAAGGGGGGGAVKKVNLVVTPGSSYTITVGAKGTGSAGAVGGNAGFTEVLLSGTTLVRSYGGQGGGGVISGTSTAPTLSRTLAGGGGQTISEGTAVNHYAGGGGGATNGSIMSTTSNNILASSEATLGTLATATISASTYVSSGSGGIDGYGAGGSGGWVSATSPLTKQYSTFSYNAGAGAVVQSTGGADGGAAIANTGCGGGGAGTYTNATSRAGGNGADGLVRVVYFA
jgi:hypothetical protein